MLTQETIRTLNRLVQTCRDGEELCRALSETAATPALADTLRSRSEGWARQGDELQALVLTLDGRPETHGTPAGWLSRARLRAQRATRGRSDAAALVEWESLRARASERYEEALERYLPERVRRTVSLQALRLAGGRGAAAAARGRYVLHTHGA